MFELQNYLNTHIEGPKTVKKNFRVIYTFNANRKNNSSFFCRFIRTKYYVALITWPENPYPKIMLFSFFFRS